MLRLNLNGTDIELYKNEPVNISYQFSDIQNINSSASSFSQTFRVPLTKKNQGYFGAVNEFGLVTTWDPKVKVSAELTYNTIPVMRGFAQVKGVYVQKGKYADVELAVFGETANLSRDIGDGMLTDLDLSSFNHTLSAANIEASWAGTLSSGAIRYGLPDKGQNWRQIMYPLDVNFWTSTAPLQHGDFTPYFRASKLLDTILTGAGYTYTSTFFGSNLDDLYLTLYNGNLAIKGNENPSGQTMLVGYATDQTGLSGNSFASLTGLSESSPFYDTGSNFSGSTYTAPLQAYYTFRVNLFGRISHATESMSFRLSKDNGTTALWNFLPVTSGAVFDDTPQNFTSEPFLLDVGETINLQYKHQNSGHTLDLDGDGTFSPNQTWWEVVAVSAPTSGQTVDVAENMPKMKQIDFVSGLQKMFNLVFIPDRNNGKHLYIEPFNDYMASGEKKDWTNKIDLTKDISITPTTDLQARQYDWTHSNGKDLVNALVFKNASRVYSRYRVDDPVNDFASGNKAIKSPFAPHVVSYIPGTQFAVHRMLVDTDQADKTIKEPLPRLAFWNGKENGTIYYQNDSSGTTTDAQYPVFSQYSDLEATVTDEDLGYGAERPFHIIKANPLETLYYKYWRPFVNELYSSDARKLTAFFRLTRSELASFEFADKVYIKDTYWRVLSVSYDATGEGMAKVELLKVLGDIRDCYYIPTGINKANGRIEFSTPSGGTVTSATRECCERYGYVFDDSGLTSICLQPFEQ